MCINSKGAHLFPEDEVFVTSWGVDDPEGTTEVGIVQSAEAMVVTLTDGRKYWMPEGIGFGTGFGTQIEPVKVRTMALEIEPSNYRRCDAPHFYLLSRQLRKSRWLSWLRW